MRKIISCVLLALLVTNVAAQNNRVTEKIDIEIKKRALNSIQEFNIKNINGDVKVSGYDGDEIQISGSKTIKTKGRKLSQNIVDDIYLRQEKHEGVLYVFVEAPGVEVEFRKGGMNYSINSEQNRRNGYSELQYEFNIEVKMPHNMALKSSTINGEMVIVENMFNGVDASNVNGDVFLKEVIGTIRAHAVNGNIEVYFAESPDSESEFKTVNGSIEVYSPKDLGAVVTFRSLHGELYTDFEKVTHLKNQFSKQKTGNGYSYKIGKNSPIQIGEGGPKMSFVTVNGSAYIQKRK